MHAASRESLDKLNAPIDSSLSGDNAVAEAAQTGSELFDIVEVLDSDRGLRVAVADPSVTAEQRSDIVAEAVRGQGIRDNPEGRHGCCRAGNGRLRVRCARAW